MLVQPDDEARTMLNDALYSSIESKSDFDSLWFKKKLKYRYQKTIAVAGYLILN